MDVHHHNYVFSSTFSVFASVASVFTSASVGVSTFTSSVLVYWTSTFLYGLIDPVLIFLTNCSRASSFSLLKGSS